MQAHAGELNAYDILTDIQTSYGQRTDKSTNKDNFRKYLKNKISDIGYQCLEQNFNCTYEDDDDHPIDTTGINYIFTKQGKSSKVVVIGAHYDSVNTYGIDDNGSGVAVLLETASWAYSQNDLPYTVRFILFDQEENDNCGSSYYVNNLSDNELGNISLMINIDSIAAGDNCYIYGGLSDYNYHVFLTDPVYNTKDIADKNGVNVRLRPTTDPSRPSPAVGEYSDDAEFKKKGIPSIYFEATNWDIPADGYSQTVKLGAIMHTAYDNLTELVDNFGADRIKGNLATYYALLKLMLQNMDDVLKARNSVYSTGQSNACSHEYEWVEDTAATADSDAKLVYKCKKCGNIAMRMTEANSAFLSFNQNSEKKIKKASLGATVTIDTSTWNSFYRSVMDTLSDRPDLTLVIEYTDAGNRRQITIPAGTDITSLIDDNGYTGFDFLVSKGYETDYWEGRLKKK